MTTTPANATLRNSKGRRSPFALSALALLALSLASGCPGNAAECEVASDCPGEQVCNGSGECVEVNPPEPDPGPGTPDPCSFVTCSGQGTCAVANGEALCVCNEGYTASGLECIEDSDSCDGVDCSGNGTCALANGAAVCICDDGYDAQGLTCVESQDPCNGVTCSGQGVCIDNNGTPVCQCNDGYTPSADRQECIADGDPCAGVTCSNNGTCESTADTVQCNCDPGYSAVGLTCVSDGDPCDGVTCSGQGTCEANGGTPTCNCDPGFTPEGLDCVEEVELDGGPGPGDEPPEEWTCAAALYADGDCDCGCGAPDPQCADETATSCDVNHCDEGEPRNDDNTKCFPSEWLCFGEFWGDGECDCGCGITDVDCPATTADVCDFTLCQDGNNTAKPTNNAVCFPSAWNCNGDFYDDTADVCDCGCGATDPDCDDGNVGSCQFCNAPGSCSEGSACPGAIDPTDNASCDCIPQCDVCRTAASDDTCGGTCEPNCAGTCNGDTCVGQADISSVSLTADSSTVVAGESIVVRHQYSNIGGQTTGNFDYAFYLHTSSTNLSSGTLLQLFQPASMAAGENRGPFAVSLTIPQGTTPGSYVIGVVYDINNTVTEANEANNERTVSITVGAGQADLTVPEFTLDATTVTAGGQLLASYTRRNIGDAATGGFVDGFFLSSDPVITPQDTLQQSAQRLSLAPNEQLVANDIPVTIQSGTPPGTYYLGYYVDVDDTVDEASETNNYRSVQIVVQGSGLPDLRPVGFNVLTTAAVAPGENITVNYSRNNQGTSPSGAFRFSVRVSDNDRITTLDEDVFSLNVNNLDPGQTQGPFSPSVTLPGDLHAGIYWAGAVIDDTFVVEESNEDNNNSAGRPFPVVPNTCSKYIQFAELDAGDTEADPYKYFDGTQNCAKADGTNGVCLDNDTAGKASSVGFFSDTAHGSGFLPIYGGFPDTLDDDDWYVMHVDDNFGATLDVEIAMTGDDATGDLDLEVYFVCDSGNTQVNPETGTECSAATVNGEAAQRCRAFNQTPDETVRFAPSCSGFDESGEVYVRVNRFNAQGCYPYTINGHY